MKASQMIQILQRAIKESGKDVEVVIYARDYFSRYGEPADISEVDMNSGIWDGVRRHENEIQFDARIREDRDGRRPKITFRASKY